MRILAKIKAKILNHSDNYTFYREQYNILNEKIKKDSISFKMLEDEINQLKIENNFYKKSNFVEPGHFYSPIPNINEIKDNEKKAFSRNNILYGIDLNQDVQFKYLNSIKAYYKELPFEEEVKKGLRYKYNNPNFGFSDAFSLFGMIKNLKPKKIIEVGSGFSSCVTLDTNELFFNNNIETTFIEPYPELLYSLIKKEDKKKNLKSFLQDYKMLI